MMVLPAYKRSTVRLLYFITCLCNVLQFFMRKIKTHFLISAKSKGTCQNYLICSEAVSWF